jgi:hypothetical protein
VESGCSILAEQPEVGSVLRRNETFMDIKTCFQDADDFGACPAKRGLERA